MLPDGTQIGDVLFVLLVTSDDEHEKSLRTIFQGTPDVIRRVSDCSEALQLLDELKPVTVLVEADLQTGNWKHLLHRTLGLPGCPPLIAFSRLADHRLWAEVLNLGGYDVLATPFEAEEVLRVISSAVSSRSRKPPATSTSFIAAA